MGTLPARSQTIFCTHWLRQPGASNGSATRASAHRGLHVFVDHPQIESSISCATDRCRCYDYLNQSSGYVVDEPGNQPTARQCGNRAKRSDVNGHCCPGIGDGFGLEFAFLHLKIMRQLGGLSRQAGHAAVSVLKHDDVKLAAASWNFSGKLTDLSQQPQLFQ
jgi:hypothetical protein